MSVDKSKIRMTRQRRVILDELAKVRTHPTADEVYRLVVSKLPKISLATIYRNLEFLSGIGLIQKIELAGSQMRYDGTVDCHYHVRCIKCGAVDDLPGEIIENLEKKYQPYTSFRLTGCRIEFIGVCPKCRKGKRKKRSGGAASSGGKNRIIDPSEFDRLYSKYNHMTVEGGRRDNRLRSGFNRSDLKTEPTQSTGKRRESWLTDSVFTNAKYAAT